MAKRKAYEKVPSSLLIRAMQIRQPWDYHLTSVSWRVSESPETATVGEAVMRKELTVVGNVWFNLNGKQNGRSPEKIGIELPYNLAILLLGIYLPNT